MGRRNAFTFAKRQRELEKKKKKDAKKAARAQRKADGLDPDLDFEDAELNEDGSPVTVEGEEAAAQPAPVPDPVD